MRLYESTPGKLITMRHEEKYICSESQLLLIEHRLKNILSYDANTKDDSYLIRSLYLDTIDDRFYNESLNGLRKRRKFRIRYYDFQQDFIRLERKDTIGNLKSKTSVVCSYEDVAEFIKTGYFKDGDNPLLKEVHMLNVSEGLKPIAVIDYNRTAFTYELGNIRITFDRNISCSYHTDGMFDEKLVRIPVMPQGKHVLEVKYDGILPGYIAGVLEIGSLERISFSKYVYARNVMEYNGRREEGYEY